MIRKLLLIVSTVFLPITRCFCYFSLFTTWSRPLYNWFTKHESWHMYPLSLNHMLSDLSAVYMLVVLLRRICYAFWRHSDYRSKAGLQEIKRHFLPSPPQTLSYVYECRCNVMRMYIQLDENKESCLHILASNLCAKVFFPKMHHIMLCSCSTIHSYKM